MSNYTDKEHVDIANQEYHQNGYQLDDYVRINKGETTIGQIARVQDGTDSGSGEQVYVITPNGTADNPESVQEVTVLFRGSTSFFKGEDWVTDWVKNDIPMAARIFAGPETSYPYTEMDEGRGTEQLKVSAQALKDILKTYPNAQFNIYAHSLGSMDAQYAMADLKGDDVLRIKGAWIYNGPNTYSTMSRRQQKQVDRIKGRIYNYIDHKDFIGLGYAAEGSEEAVGIVGHVYSREVTDKGWVGNITEQHMWGGYRYDEKGNLLLETNTLSTYHKDLYTYTLKELKESLELLQTHKKALSQGGYSEHEQIYLDSEQALAIGAAIAAAAQSGAEELEQLQSNAAADLQSAYNTALAGAALGKSLSGDEIEAILAEEGAGRTDIVDKPAEELLDKVSQAQTISGTLTEKEGEIEQGVAALLESDTNLAKEFSQWRQM